MSTWTRWQDWAGVVLGVLLFITPFVFGGMASSAAEWTAFIGGVLLVILGLIDLSNPTNRAGEWTEAVLGVLLFIAPWALGFTGLSAMAWSAWIVGVLSVLLAASVLFGGAERPAMVGQR
jgi:uncharacterized membrane protein